MNGDEMNMHAHDLIGRIYRDDRFPGKTLWGDLRMFAVTAIWVGGVELVPPGQRWRRIMEVMRLEHYQLRRLIGEDAPRYEPPRGDGECEGVMIRRAGPCGKRGVVQFRVTDPATGEWRTACFCPRHSGQADEARRAENARLRSGALPTPLPNTGGLLPCYLHADWPDMYARARPGWKPPEIGICADDWPVGKKITEHAPPKLKALQGGGAGPLGGDSSGALPQLRLVPSEAP